MNTCARGMLRVVLLGLLGAFLPQVPALLGGETGNIQQITGSYLCVERPETPHKWTGAPTMEIQEDGATTYFMFPTAVVVRHGQPYPMFATGGGTWQLLESNNGNYSFAIITLTEMSIARKRNKDGEGLLEIEHPSTAGSFITRWKRIGDASEPFVRRKVSDDRKQATANDVASNTLEVLQALRGHVQVGYAAFCRYEGRIDELQVIGEVRTLDEQERNVLSEVLSAEDAWYLRTPDQKLSGSRTFSMEPADFKIVLVGEDTVFVLKMASGSRQVHVMLNDKHVALPNIRTFAFEKLRTYFDRWFPDWENVTRKNYSDWLREVRRESPNKAPEPTTTAVTPRAP